MEVIKSFSVKTEAFVELFAPYGDDVCNKVRSHHIENAGISRFDRFRISEMVWFRAYEHKSR